MRSRAIVRVSLAVLLAATAVSAASAEALRWKFKPNESLNYVLERGVDGKIVLSGAEIVFKMGMTFDTTWNVKGVADGQADIELVVDRIQVEMASPLFGNMVYDSKSAEEPKSPVWLQMKPVMESMLGGAFQIKVSPRGEVTEIALPEKTVKALEAQQIGENRRQGFGFGGNPFGEKGIKELIAKSVLLLPEAEGSDWTQSFENAMPGLGTQTAETTFTVAGSEEKDGHKLARITAATEVMFEPDENPKAELEIMSQEAKATYLFDGEAGRLVSAEGKQQLGMEVSGPQEASQEITETMKMRLGKSPDKPAEKKPSEAKAEK